MREQHNKEMSEMNTAHNNAIKDLEAKIEDKNAAIAKFEAAAAEIGLARMQIRTAARPDDTILGEGQERRQEGEEVVSA